jgi:hypothetical protein
MCICCYFYQFFELTNEYLAYKYTVIIEFNEYRDSNGVLSAENFPTISFCTQISFLTELRKRPNLQNSFRIEKHFDMISDSLNYSLCWWASESLDLVKESECSAKIADIINREQNMSNYVKFMYYLPAELNFENFFYYGNSIMKTQRCLGNDKFVFSRTLLGECFSLFTSFTFKAIENQTIEKSNEFQILIGIEYNS